MSRFRPTVQIYRNRVDRGHSVTRPLAKIDSGFQKKMLKVFSLNLLERERERERENSYNCYLKNKKKLKKKQFHLLIFTPLSLSMPCTENICMYELVILFLVIFDFLKLNSFSINHLYFLK